METATSSIPSREGGSLLERGKLVDRLRSSPQFQEYQRAFQTITNLPLELRDAASMQQGLDGLGAGSPVGILLARLAKRPATCLQSRRQLEETSREGPGTIAVFAGIHESAVPIRLGNQAIAFLQTGQILFRRPTPADARKAARIVEGLEDGIDRQEWEAAYLRTRVIRRSNYNSLLRMLELYACYLSEQSNRLMIEPASNEPRTITRARSYVTDHLVEDLSLPQLSRAVGMSPCYFCKYFKRSTGMTFTSYLSRVRVEAVKQLMLDPHRRVSEAAYEAGFQSISQFNRIFHRVTGFAPSEFRERLHSVLARCQNSYHSVSG